MDEDELADLYARCLAVFYAPVDEDFGMVPYEAFLADKPVVTTVDAGVPPMFDRPADRRAEPRRACGRCVRVRLREHLDQARSTAAPGTRSPTRSPGIARSPDSGMKVAYYSPLPPERSGIADQGALLLPALERRFDVEAARRRWPALRKTDVALYHLGNNPQAHGWIVDALRRRPGVKLHDLVLHHLVAGLTLARGNSGAYIAAME